MVQDLGVFKLKSGPSLKLKSGPSVFFVFPIFIVFLDIFRNTNSATVCQNSVFAKFGGCQKWGFRKENCICCFFLFYAGKIETEKRKKRKWKRPKNPIKIGFFKGGHPKMWRSKKNGFLAKIAWHYMCQEGRKNAHFRAHYLFWPKFFLDQNSANQEKL